MKSETSKLDTVDMSGDGNTTRKPPRCPLCKYWAFTFFPEMELLSDKSSTKARDTDFLKGLKEMLMPSSEKGIVGLEECPTTKKLHCQGFVAFKKRTRATEKFKGKFHWEKAIASEDANEKYCSKDGLFIKWGIFKSDFLITKGDLNPQQLKIAELFVLDCNPKFDRIIHYCWESIGGWGKSLVSTYMVDNMDALLLNGAKNNMFFALSKFIESGKYPRLIVIDMPREQKSNFNVLAIESIKNGIFFNEKYESGMCRFPRPHVVVFSNYPPDCSRMSADRWNVISLRGESINVYDDEQ
jgi:hypothetical protein